MSTIYDDRIVTSKINSRNFWRFLIRSASNLSGKLRGDIVGHNKTVTGITGITGTGKTLPSIGTVSKFMTVIKSEGTFILSLIRLKKKGNLKFASCIHLEIILIHLDLFGSIRIYFDVFGSIWIYLDPFGSIWIHLDLFGYILIHSDI